MPSLSTAPTKFDALDVIDAFSLLVIAPTSFPSVLSNEPLLFIAAVIVELLSNEPEFVTVA